MYKNQLQVPYKELFFLNYSRVSCQQNAPSSRILWCIFSTDNNILHIHSTTIVIKEFKIIHYYSLILIRLDPHSSFTKCSIISFIEKKIHTRSRVTFICYVCLIAFGLEQFLTFSLISITLILLKLLGQLVL